MCQVSEHWSGVSVGEITVEVGDHPCLPLLSGGTSEEVFFVFYGVVARWALYRVFVIIVVDQVAKWVGAICICVWLETFVFLGVFVWHGGVLANLWC